MSIPYKPEFTVAVTPRSDGFVPYDYQRRAWQHLDAAYERDRVRAGVLVVPTGGGKTAIAARWLLDRHVREGGRVLWFAHRKALLRQAFQTFAAAAHLTADARRERLHLITVSGDDRKLSNVDVHHDVIFASVGAVCGERKLGNLDLIARASRGPGLFAVVDEAHHASAAGYARVIGRLKELGCPVLGLTATPVRMSAQDNARLARLLERIVYQISSRELFGAGVLAEPALETVRTNVSLEAEFTPEDWRHLDEFGDLPAAVLERLGRDASRNTLIADHYARHRDRYGKTIIFCNSVMHARTLVDELKRRGVDADHVDHARADSLDVMRRFRETSSPMVLANVEMLTEGFDAPKTQTVFLARPTRSEALFRQMIGRALRGPKAQGTKTAFLVSFVDAWEQFHPIEAESVLAPGEEAADDAPTTRPDAPGGAGALLPATVLNQLYELFRSRLRGSFESYHQCVPHGWYAWEQEFEGDVQQRVVLVFENQRGGFAALMERMADPAAIPEALTEGVVQGRIIAPYFRDCHDPLPRWKDVADLLAARRAGFDVRYVTFEEKARFDPDALARRFYDAQLGDAAKHAELTALWRQDEVCRYTYRFDFQQFLDDVGGATRRLLVARNPTPEVEALQVPPPTEHPGTWGEGFEGWSVRRLLHNLTHADRLGVHFPRGVPVVDEVRWADRPLRGTWGFCRYTDRTIVLNPRLNSPDVPLFVVEFLLYHEMLHADLVGAGHDPEFRRRESLYVPSPEAVEDAKTRGIAVASRPRNLWQLAADNYLDTWQHRFAY